VQYDEDSDVARIFQWGV